MSTFDGVDRPVTNRQQEGALHAALPRYQCHKKVWAVKIKSIAYDHEAAAAENRETDGSALITPVEPGYGPIRVDRMYVLKHKPKADGYYVVYEGGYASWSPADAFEAGYTRL